MERMETQRKQIKNWLESGRSITPIEALNLFGAFRLSAHIYALKNNYDMPIETEMVYEDKKNTQDIGLRKKNNHVQDKYGNN